MWVHGSVTPSYSYTLQDSDFVGLNNKVEIGLGVVDAIDTAVSSNLSIWDLEVTSGTGGTPTPDPEPTPEPSPEPIGDIEFQEFGNAFKSSSGLISMSTGFGSISQLQVEQNLGLTVGELDTNLNESKTAINATEGSGITATFAANAGDIVSFSYEFGTNDYIPYQDFSFFAVNGQSQSLAVVGVDTPNYGSTTGVINYTITNEDIQNSLGNVQFSVGIVDALDNVVDSYLKLSDFNVSNTSSELSDINGNGLIDGLNAYVASSNSSKIKLTDSNKNELKSNTSSNWNIDGVLVSTSNSSSFELLAKGTGSNAGKIALWQADSSGTLDQSVDSLTTPQTG